MDPSDIYETSVYDAMEILCFKYGILDDDVLEGLRVSFDINPEKLKEIQTYLIAELKKFFEINPEKEEEFGAELRKIRMNLLLGYEII